MGHVVFNSWKSLALSAFLCAGIAAPAAGVIVDADPQPPSPPGGPSSAPATAPGGAEHLQATVTGVEGLAQYRGSPTAQWKKAIVGLVLDEGAQFRTGVKSAVRFSIPPDHTYTIDRLGVASILQAVQENGMVRTDVGMPHGGRVRLEIEAAGVAHESVIHSPNSTLAVRGTQVTLTDERPFAPEAVSLTGRAAFASARKRTRFGGKNAGTTVVSSNQNSAERALSSAVVDPSIVFARTPEEQPLVANLLSQGAVLSLSNMGNFPVIRGGTHPTSDAALLPLLPGRLDFVLRWDGNANLDLIVGDQAHGGEALLPAHGVNTTRTGGRTNFDHQGGPNGGIEIAYWLKTFPTGFYSAFINHTSGAATDFTLDVFVDGKRTIILDPLNRPVATFEGSVGPGVGNNELATVPIGTPGFTDTAARPARQNGNVHGRTTTVATKTPVASDSAANSARPAAPARPANR